MGNTWNPRRLLTCILLLSLAGVLAGCLPTAILKPTRENSETSGRLKVLLAASQNRYYQYTAQSFFEKIYTDPFKLQYPKIQIEVIPITDISKTASGELDLESIKQLITDERPDFIYMNAEQYDALAAENLLTRLDTIIERDKLDLDVFYSPVLQSLDKGGYYGLSPSFDSLALFYNKSIFDAKDIEYPKSGMNWEEWLQLASQFSVQETGDTRAFGVSQPPYSRLGGLELFRFTGESVGLSRWDAASEQEMGQWSSLLDRFAALYRSGSIAPPEARQFAVSQSDHGNDAFMQGNAAMTIRGADFFRNLLEVAREPGKITDWGVVPLPISPDHTERTLGFSTYEVYGIPAEARNPEAAWTLLRYICGDSQAKLAMEPPFKYFPSNSSQWHTIDMIPFTELKPEPGERVYDFHTIPDRGREQRAIDAIRQDGTGTELLKLIRESYQAN